MDMNTELQYYNDYESSVDTAAEFLKERFGQTPKFGLVLGSGLGDLANSITNTQRIFYSDIPFFPQPGVAGHAGELYIGDLEGVPIVALKGRKHFYEVADRPFNNGIRECVFPVHVLAQAGIKNYFVTNASGGLNLEYNVGDAMIITSHINKIPNPLLGKQLDLKTVKGENLQQFQPMNGAYDSEFRELLKIAGKDFAGHVHEGVYLATTGPTYETEGECIEFRRIGADAVGMSTAPEVIVARNRGMRVVGMSCITNVIAQDGTNATDHEEVKRILESREVRERLSGVVKGFFREYTR